MAHHPSSEELIQLALDEALKALSDALSFIDDNIDHASLRPGRVKAFLKPVLTKRDIRRSELVHAAIKAVKSASDITRPSSDRQKALNHA